ncbi:LacI family DNA-binding transcriptional regulator [Luteimicrobium album]|uniref:LacI family DNA-binding transcriptional regulator n=1 Tax=Luteimicrobium album TaxID=1054550 RepID=UPI0032AEB144
MVRSKRFEPHATPALRIVSRHGVDCAGTLAATSTGPADTPVPTPPTTARRAPRPARRTLLPTHPQPGANTPPDAPKGGRTTLSEVAALAGVSVSTASLAFSGSGPIADATRDRVLAAATELGYTGPSPSAASSAPAGPGSSVSSSATTSPARFVTPCPSRSSTGSSPSSAPTAWASS